MNEWITKTLDAFFEKLNDNPIESIFLWFINLFNTCAIIAFIFMILFFIYETFIKSL